MVVVAYLQGAKVILPEWRTKCDIEKEYISNYYIVRNGSGTGAGTSETGLYQKEKNRRERKRKMRVEGGGRKKRT